MRATSLSLVMVALLASACLKLEDEFPNVNPAHPEMNKSVEFGKIAVVSIADAKVGRIKEIQVTVEMKDATKWSFGERFMDAALLQEFTEHLQEKIRNVES